MWPASHEAIFRVSVRQDANSERFLEKLEQVLPQKA